MIYVYCIIHILVPILYIFFAKSYLVRMAATQTELQSCWYPLSFSTKSDNITITVTHLARYFAKGLFAQHHPGREAQHDQSVARITKHHRKQEGEGGSGEQGWNDEWEVNTTLSRNWGERTERWEDDKNTWKNQVGRQADREKGWHLTAVSSPLTSTNLYHNITKILSAWTNPGSLHGSWQHRTSQWGSGRPGWTCWCGGRWEAWGECTCGSLWAAWSSQLSPADGNTVGKKNIKIHK